MKVFLKGRLGHRHSIFITFVSVCRRSNSIICSLCVWLKKKSRMQAHLGEAGLSFNVRYFSHEACHQGLQVPSAN